MSFITRERSAISGRRSAREVAPAARPGKSAPQRSAALQRERGGALLAVLWLSAALAAIAFAVAVSVRGEISRAETTLEGVKAYYLAQGALDRAINYMTYGPGPRLPNGVPRYWERGMPVLPLRFPEGDAVVEVIPETSRLNVNGAPPEQLQRLLTAMGVAPPQAGQIAMAIVDWRGGAPGQGPFDALYSSQSPSFRAPHASMQQIEDLLSVAGVTPELFYGRYERTPQGAAARRAGLRDCLTVFSVGGLVDINTAEPEVMIALGAPPQGAMEVAALRRRSPIVQAQMPALAPMLGPAAGQLGFGTGNIFTLKATARPRRQDGKLSDLRRSVAMTVRLPANTPSGVRVLRRYENASTWPTYFEVWQQ